MKWLMGMHVSTQKYSKATIQPSSTVDQWKSSKNGLNVFRYWRTQMYCFTFELKYTTFVFGQNVFFVYCMHIT